MERRVPSYALSPDGRVLAVGHADGTVALIDARTLRRARRFRAVADGPVRGMGVRAADGRLLVVGGDDGFLALVDPRRGTVVTALPRPPRTACFTPELQRRRAADGDRRRATTPCALWTLPSGRPAGAPRLHYRRGRLATCR